ncbi:hypothetical protein VaNZ11_015349 [Volvox africanus]|uniref:PAS domain-containing protein n=1 Tax=Volvox africanus TaxID=51714 RepID=A0ABQ5SKW9_9CHLO|nr:hypothetical protein VaNZ11_015349 [Volvox africanus]
MAGAVLLAVVCLIWLTVAMRKHEQSKWMRRMATVLHVVYELIFMIFYVSFLDFLVFTANCRFTDPSREHEYFAGVKCLQMPHVMHMSVALVAAVVHFCVTALLVVASADLNPLSLSYLASPGAVSRLKILAAKAAFIIFAADLQSWPRLQAVLMNLAVVFICWHNFRKLPFYRMLVNVVWCSLWICVLYTCLMLAVLEFGKDPSLERRRRYTLYVIYGIFPVLSGGLVVCGAHAWWAMRPASKFEDLRSFRDVRVQKLHRFAHVHEVELLSRVMRRLDGEGGVEEDAAMLGDAIIRAGMLTFPNSPFLYVLYANFLLEVRKDGPAARTQLQLAAKHGPSLLERYQIYCTMEASKRLKDGRDGGMDLQAYIEFRRNFKAVLRVHKDVLALELELWRTCLRSTLRVAEIDSLLDELEAATARANQVYKKVLERYPTNGKLLRCYGKFLEDVQHDAQAAARVYIEAARCGGADAIMSLDLSSVQQASHKPEFLTSLSLLDDAVVVINAEGIIMMVSQAVQSVFGYGKAELEGFNVSLLMPQPFNQRHDSYLARYIDGGEAHILDTVREVVALHKDRYVFPVDLCVTKMSGSGSDSVFLGVMRPLPTSTLRSRAWLAPNGIFLCGDQQFASLCGLTEKNLVGRSLASLCANPDSEIMAMLERFRQASAAELSSGLVRWELLLRHRFLEPVPVEAVVGLGGTEGQRIMALSCRRTDGRDGNLLVVDTHMRLRFASLGLCTLLNYPMRKLAGMRLDKLLPPPYNSLHAKWLRAPPHIPGPTSCRSGRVVHLLNDAGLPVQVRIKVQPAAGDDLGMSLYVVQVEKVNMDEVYDEKRLVLIADFSGHVLSVSRSEAALFGFPAREMVGRSLCDSIDVFGDWRKRNGESQLHLLMLALIDREQEMPGTSWRVRVQSPVANEDLNKLPPLSAALPSMRRKLGAGSISACLQVELVEVMTADDIATKGAAGGTSSRWDSQLLPGFKDGVLEAAGAPAVAAAAVPGSCVASAADVRIKLTLWRRDLLTGLVELDEQLVIRKASPLTGLIVGLPSTAMLKKPMQKFLDIPHHKTWAEICKSVHSHKRSSLRGGNERGIVSPMMAFLGPHPDMGTMRIIIQGVQTLAPGGRKKVTVVLHPDTTFVGAHADLMRVLHLEGMEEGGRGDAEAALSRPHTKGEMSRLGTASSGAAAGRIGNTAHDRQAMARQGKRSALASASASAVKTARSDSRRVVRHVGGSDDGDGDRDGYGGDDEERGSSNDGDGSSRSSSSSNGDGNSSAVGAAAAGASGTPADEEVGSDGDADAEAKGQAQLLRKASNKSEFIAQWVRTVSQRALNISNTENLQDPDSGGDRGVGMSMRPGAEQAPRVPASSAARSPTASAEKETPWLCPGPGLQPSPSSSGPSVHPSALKHTPVIGTGGRLAAIPEGPDGDDCGGGGHGGVGGGDGAANKWERGSEGGDSSAEGSQAASGVTSVTDNQSSLDVVVDMRRGKLLKSLRRVLMGPFLMTPWERMRLHSYFLLTFMLLTHIACYIVVTRVVSREHTGVYMVHRQARAMDRTSLLVVRILIGTFCERANNTHKVSACTPPLSTHLVNMVASIKTLEEDHQGVYLGFSSSKVSALSSRVYDIWTSPQWEYDIFVDTQPPRVMSEVTGVWQLGNRFLAASREALYWMPVLRDTFKFHRTYQFMVANGLGSLFVGYATSLDELMAAAWSSLDDLRTILIIVLVVEVVAVQLTCLSYAWLLMQRLERVRLMGVLSMLGLPGPVLRQMGNKEVKVLGDSDDELDDDDSSAKDGGEQEGRAAGRGKKVDGEGGAKNQQSEAWAGRDASGGGDTERTAAAVRLLPPPLTAGGGAKQQVPSERNVHKGCSNDADGPQERAKAGPDDDGGKAGEWRSMEVALAPLAWEDTALVPLDAAPTHSAASTSSAGTGSENGTGPGTSHASAARLRKVRWTSTAAGTQYINGKALIPSKWRGIKFMFLPALWFGALLAIYIVGIMSLSGMQGPLAALNMASHVVYRYTRVRAVGFSFLSQDDAISRALWRDMLNTEVRLFISEYDALMYGGTAVSQANSVFTHAVPPSTFASASFADAFFRTKRCFRYNQSLCAQPGSPYYEVTHNGLDAMVRRMITEMELLISDDDQDVKYNGSRWTYMYQVGTFDLYEGLQQAAQLFVDYSISRYNEVTTLHTILLIATILLFAVYVVFVLWPHLAKLKADAARQSALLSHVPVEVDAVGHVKAIIRAARPMAAQRVAVNKAPTTVATTTGV